MAFWQRKKTRTGDAAVYVYAWSDGKQRALPRAETRHLDGEPDHNVESWVANWALAHEGRRAEASELVDADWIALLDRYLAYLAAKGREPATRAWHRQMLRDYVLPYFLGPTRPWVRPPAWPARSVRLLAHLVELGLPIAGQLRATTAARLFWRWLVEEGEVPDPRPLLLRTPANPRRPTPLRFAVTPDDVLAFARTSDRRDVRLMALLGYFFSLRPQEVFALRPADFVAGAKAGALEGGDAMRRMGQFDRLAVRVWRERTQAGAFRDPKAHSVGYVSCFSAEAARLVVAELNAADPEASLFAYGNDWLFRIWRRHGYSGVTPKDLRRASLYWLGHRTPFSGHPILLQKHARHSDLETTQLYLRRPEEPESGQWERLDLDA